MTMEIMRTHDQTEVDGRLPWARPELRRLEISVDTQNDIKSASYADLGGLGSGYPP